MSFIALIPLNGAYLYLIFPLIPNVRLAGWIMLIVSVVACVVIGEIDFEKTEFDIIRYYLAAGWVFSTVVLIVGHQYIKQGRDSIVVQGTDHRSDWCTHCCDSY